MKKTIIIFLILFIYQSISFALTVDPTEIGVGARPLGMGKAFVGFSGDVNSIFIDPAGIADISDTAFTSMNSRVFDEVNYTVLGVAKKYDFGTIGFGYLNASLGGIPVTDIVGATIEVLGYAQYTGSVLIFSYGNYLNNIPMLPPDKNISYGLNLKYYLQSISGTSELMGNGIDIDASMHYKISDAMTFGLSLINMLPDTIGGNFTWQNGDKESIPMVIKYGLSTRLYGSMESVYNSEQELYLVVNGDLAPEKNWPLLFHVGSEWWPTKYLAVRLGLDQSAKGTSAGVGVENNLGAGIGLKYSNFSIDYSYKQMGDIAGNLTHFVSIGYDGIM